MKNLLFNNNEPKYSPSLILPLPGKDERLETVSQLSLYNGLQGEPDKDLVNHYKTVSEIYALNFDNTVESTEALINSDGAIAEMYMDVIKHEQDKGESPRSKQQKGRLVIIQRSIELLRKYFNKFEQAKHMLKLSIDERTRMLVYIKELKEENEKLKKQLKF